MSVVRRVALLVGLIASVACVACSGKPEVTSSASKSKEETGAFAWLLPSDATPDAWALELAKAEKQVVDQGRRGAGYEDALGPQFEDLILLSDDQVQRTLGQLMAELGIDISRLTAAEGDSGRETSDDSVGTASQAIGSSAALFSSVYGILTLSFAIDANLTTSATHTKQLPPEETTIAGVAGTSNVTTTITITPSGSHTLAELTVTTDLVARDVLTGASRGFVKEVATALATLDICPDADGIVQGTLTLKSEGQVFNAQSADGTEGVGFHSNVNGRFRYRVNDAAEHVGTEIEGATDYEAKGGRQPSGGGSPDLFSKRATAQWHSLEFENPRAFSVDEHEGDLDDVEYILKRSVFGLGMAALELARPAKKAWRGGTCVEVRFDRASSQVSPGETLAIVATPYHKIEEQELSTPIVPELNGTASLLPLGEAVPSPASLLYVAGSEPNDSGTITATSTSKRGIGTGTVTFTTRPNCGPCEHWDAAQNICVPECDPSNCGECASYCVNGECDSDEWEGTIVFSSRRYAVVVDKVDEYGITYADQDDQADCAIGVHLKLAEQFRAESAVTNGAVVTSVACTRRRYEHIRQPNQVGCDGTTGWTVKTAETTCADKDVADVKYAFGLENGAARLYIGSVHVRAACTRVIIVTEVHGWCPDVYLPPGTSTESYPDSVIISDRIFDAIAPISPDVAELKLSQPVPPADDLRQQTTTVTLKRVAK